MKQTLEERLQREAREEAQAEIISLMELTSEKDYGVAITYSKLSEIISHTIAETKKAVMESKLSEIISHTIAETKKAVMESKPPEDNKLYGLSVIVNEKSEDNPEYNRGFLTGYNTALTTWSERIEKL